MQCSSLIATAIRQGDISTILVQEATHTPLVEDLQRVLFELGFKKELKLDKYEVDGIYGPATVNAVTSFATKNNVQCDGTSVSNTLAKLMLQRHGFLPDMYQL